MVQVITAAWARFGLRGLGYEPNRSDRGGCSEHEDQTGAEDRDCCPHPSRSLLVEFDQILVCD